MDLSSMIEKVEGCQILPEVELKMLCLKVMEILIEEPNVTRVKSPVTVVGDTHGQFHDLLELFNVGGNVPSTSYVFMGDYVDRGFHSVETMTYLLLLKAKYPESIVLLRGNHESRQVTTSYGFHDEIVQKYGNGSLWKYFMDVFDVLSLCAIIDGKIMCVHGGLSPHIKTIRQIELIERRKEIPPTGPFTDLMWSDPDDSLKTWELNARGCGMNFGSRIAREFCEINNLELICRSHQLVMEGHKFHFEEKNVVTVWSCPNYCYRSGNVASILEIDRMRRKDFKTFREVEENHKTAEMMKQQKPSYFM